MKEPKITKARLFPTDNFAFYSPSAHEIYYDELLDEFPELKERLLAHELEHAEHEHNMARHMLIEIRDYIKFSFDREIHEYKMRRAEMYSRMKPKGFWEWTGMALYHSFMVVFTTLLLPVVLMVHIYYKYQKVKKDEP